MKSQFNLKESNGGFSFNFTLIENTYQLSCWRFIWWILWRLLGKLICKLNFSTLYQTRKDRMMKSVVNKLGRCFWSQSNCDLISTTNLGLLLDVKNSTIDAIKILIIRLQSKTSVTSFLSLVHIGYWIKLNKKRWNIQWSMRFCHQKWLKRFSNFSITVTFTKPSWFVEDGKK